MLNSLFLTIFQDFRFFSAEVDSKIQSIPSNIAENLTSLSLTGVGTARDFDGCRSMDAYPTKLANYVMAATHKKKIGYEFQKQCVQSVYRTVVCVAPPFCFFHQWHRQITNLPDEQVSKLLMSCQNLRC